MTSQQSVLIVEDDAVLRDLLHQILQMGGYDVSLASNGREALDLLQGGLTPCLMIVDLMMPVMNGWEFLEACEAEPKYANVPKIVMSAVVDAAAQVSADAFLPKPADFDEIIALVQRFS